MSRFRDAAGGFGAWLAAPVRPGGLGIRPIDVLATAAVITAVELNNASATGGSQQPLTAAAYAWGAAVAIPVLARRRWPRGVLVACSVLLLAFYLLDRRNISPAPLLCLPLYDAAAAGFLVLSIVVPAFYMTVGLFFVEAVQPQSLASLVAEFLPGVVMLLLAILLGDAVRTRRALAVQTAQRLRLADEEREKDGARRVAEERLRIARELHDTVAHSMATITVQSASALHVLGERPAGGAGAGGSGAADRSVRDALLAIRETSKRALADIRVTLGQLRADDGAGAGEVEPASTRTAGLGRLPALCDAVRAAGAPVTVAVQGAPAPLPPAVDHAAYRILQESLTNVLRHAGPDASADVLLRYGPGALMISVSDDGAGGTPIIRNGPPDGPGPTPAGGHGLTGMAERAAALGGELSAGPRAAGGFEVVSRLPVAPVAPGPLAAGPLAAGAAGPEARRPGSPAPRAAP